MSRNDRPSESKSTSGLAGMFRRLKSTPSSSHTQEGSSVTSSTNVLHGFRGDRSSPIAPAHSSNGDTTLLGGSTRNHELFQQLKSGNPLAIRIQATESFRQIVADYEIATVSAIWLAAQDLTGVNNPVEARHAAFKLLKACITESDSSSLDRLIYFRAIAEPHASNDFELQLDALVALSNNGKDLVAFERELQPLLCRWIPEVFRDSTIARQSRKNSKAASKSPLTSSAEVNLSQLLSFITNIIKFSFKTFEESEIVPMLNEILNICRRTTSKDDIIQSLGYITAHITYGYIPKECLASCIEVLCGAYATVKDIQEVTWSTIGNLCRSYMANNAILAIRDILENPMLPHHNNNTLRGAVCVMERLLVAREEDGLISLQFTSIMLCFQKAITANVTRLDLEICRAIYDIVSQNHIQKLISPEEWDIPLEIVISCAERNKEELIDLKLKKPTKNDKDTLPTVLFQVIQKIVAFLESQYLASDFGATNVVIETFVRLYYLIPDSCAEIVINYYATEHLCYPSCSGWLENCHTLLKTFFQNRIRPSQMRISVLSLIKDVYETVKEVSYEVNLYDLLLLMFQGMPSEDDPLVLDAIVKIAIDVANDGDMLFHKKIVDHMLQCLKADETGTPQLSTLDNEESASKTPLMRTSLSKIIVQGLVLLFMHNVNRGPEKTILVFNELVRVAGHELTPLDARLAALRLLFRLRADSDYAICIMDDTESLGIAMPLSKTSHNVGEGSNTRKIVLPERISEDPTSYAPNNRSSRPAVNQNTASHAAPIISRSLSKNVVDKVERPRPRVSLWSYPESKPLPGSTLKESSIYLFSYMMEPQIQRPDMQAVDRELLPIHLWFDTVVSMLDRGCDWEIYSYILVHLPAQLSNKAVFMTCADQISRLRTVICDQLHNNKFPIPDLPSEVKKADLAVVLIHTLTTLICYHEHFTKSDQEAVVKAFHLGLHSWQRAAKPCIHALSVCCYELPLATSKFLPGILVKLSQIITSSAVSVHILEFLSLLARLPKLIVNFTELDFKSIFAIAFRYIQHTKTQPIEQALALSRLNSNAAKANLKQKDNEGLHESQEQAEIPQYVLTLAYNVLATWFLALKLNDRAKYVSWIVRGLVVGDGVSKESLDEQSQACIDMLRRFTYADQDLRTPTLKPGSLMGQTMTKHWLLGSKIISVQTTLSSGMSQVVIRQPSGTVVFSVKLDNQDLYPMFESGADTANIAEGDDAAGSRKDDIESSEVKEIKPPTLMPSHIIMQFTSDTSSDLTRPILLPDDDAIQRALNVFDRIPVVDFHKIGVVYIGAGQYTEEEILSNVMGASDYIEFVDGLGDLLPLKGANTNTGGLDRETDLDGAYTYSWSDKVTQIIFHVVTMMPTDLKHDPRSTGKKRHIGNDFVNIIFNNSGLPFNFDTIPGQFNYVNIVIAPEARTGFVATRTKNYENLDTLFYRVQLLCKSGIPEISPAADIKMISGRNLSAFVRNLALNASVFSQVYSEGGSEHIPNWRHRLRAIIQLRDRHGGFSGSGYHISANSLSRNNNDNRRVSAATAISDKSTGADEIGDSSANGMDGLLESYDFSKWGGA